MTNNFKYKWYALGDLNAFFGLMLDNMVQLLLMATLLMSVFGFPGDIILNYMIPGTAVGVLIGDLAFTYLAFRLAKKTNNPNVTAMPLGIDTPSLIGIIFLVLGPAFLEFKSMKMNTNEAALLAWKVGMAITFLIGIFKIVMSFFAQWVQKVVPRAGLLGALAGVALLLIAFIPFGRIFENPIPGFFSLAVIILTLVARIKFKIPGAFLAVLVGTIMYYVVNATGLYTPHHLDVSISGIAFNPNLGFIDGLEYTLKYFPIAFPFAMAVLIGGINVTESAVAAGDNYNPRHIIMTDGITTMLVSLCGGVVQNTPYIGHPAYKSMGGRAGYTLATALVVGLGGIFGLISVFVAYIPEVAVAGILVFIGLEISMQAYHATPKEHAPAVAIACIPAIAYLVKMKEQGVMQTIAGYFKEFDLSKVVSILNGNTDSAASFNSALVMGNGFMLIALLWGGEVALII